MFYILFFWGNIYVSCNLLLLRLFNNEIIEWDDAGEKSKRNNCRSNAVNGYLGASLFENKNGGRKMLQTDREEKEEELTIFPIL